jgi:ATP-dependent DNA helicase UvrD/PcrA
MQLTTAHRAIIETEQRLIAALSEAVRQASPRAGQALPDLWVPCFAHLKICPAGGQARDLLLGFCSFIDAHRRVSLIDWRAAPLARVFFNFDQGETYDLELDDRALQGEVKLKRLLTFEAGELSGVFAPEVSLTRDADGTWAAAPPAAAPTLRGGDGGALPRKLVDSDPDGMRVPVVTDLLDAEQRAVVEHDARSPVLVLGGAGCGKTTVALHRLARLHQREPQRFGQRAMVVVVPEPGLARLTAAILAELGLERVGVFSYDRWIARQAQRVFSDLPRRQCEDPPARVVHLKRHSALRAVLPELVARLGARAAERLDHALAARGRSVRVWPELEGATPLARLEQLEARELDAAPEHLQRGVRRAFAAERQRLHLAREDLLLLFGDRKLLELAASRSGGELTAAMVEATLEHTRLQFSETSEETFSHVDADRLRTSDGRGLDEGTPLEVCKTVDAEDYAVCFELLRLKTGGLSTPRGRPARYWHLVLDEAQDLAPIELSVLGRALRRGGSITVCGDQAQQIDPSACFAGWEQALVELGLQGTAPAHLRTSYRCTEAVTRFSHDVLGPGAPDELPEALRAGKPVLRSCFATEAHLTYALTRALADLVDREPRTGVAVIARTAAGAARLHAALARSLPVSLVRRGEFSFAPGIEVTDVSQVKGLEFDVVVVPDATPARYPDEPDARRKLHVACTRAICGLWVQTVGRWSQIVPA